MNIKKIVLLVFLTIILTGCTMNYQVKINDDGTVEDNLTVDVANELAELYYDTPREYLDFIVDAKLKEYNLSTYKSTYEIKSDISTININNKYSSVQNYFNSPIIKVLYNTANIKNEKNKTIISLEGTKDVFGNLYLPDETYSLDNFSITIKSDLAVSSTNADKKNILTGTYTWNFSNDSLNKKIELTVSDRKNYTSLIVNKLGYWLIPVVFLIIGVIILIVYASIKRKIQIVNEI